MSTERDELEAEIVATLREADPADTLLWDVADKVAGVLVAAGYSKPRTITTLDDLNALPIGSVVRTSSDAVCEKGIFEGEPDYPFWMFTGINREFPASRVGLPAVVLEDPTP